jgi:predicted PurR-regulated permease PerM
MDNKITLQKIFLFGLFTLLFVVIIAMLKPYSTVFLWTALLYVLIKPLYKHLFKKISPDKKFYKAKTYLLAGGFSVGTLILIIGPLSFIAVMLIHQALALLQDLEHFLLSNPNFLEDSEIVATVNNFLENKNITLPLIDFNTLEEQVISFIRSSSARFFSIGKTIVTKTGSFIISLMFIVFSLYFCFLDGAYLLSLIKKAIPLDPNHMDVLTDKFSDITKNLFSGYILVALYQGIAAFIIMKIFGVEGSLLLSVLLMFASFIPMFGAALVWVPVGIILCISQSVVKGILFLIIAGICISFLDNFLRPLFLKDRINVHPLVIFFSILGGISFFGMNGLILGPLIVILFFTVLDLMVTTKEKKIE